MRAHLLQTAAWGRLKDRFGWYSQTILLPQPSGSGWSGAQLLMRRMAGIGLAYVPRGPLVDWSDRAAVAQIVEAMATQSRTQGAALLKVEPALPDTLANRKLLADLGFVSSRHTIQPASTIVIDIAGDEQAILAAMKSKWRYNIGLAARKGVTVRHASRDDLPAIQDLMDTTGRRDGFAVHSADYYAAAFDLLTPRLGVYLLAEAEGRLLAFLAVFSVGRTAWYLWGASGDRERARMPNHALQWAAICWARARGATLYDMWGIPDPIGRLAMGMAGREGGGTECHHLPLDLSRLPRHDLWGVYRFKQGFGGRVTRDVGAWDLPLRALPHRFYQIGVRAVQERSRLTTADLVSLVRSAGNGSTLPVVERVTTAQRWRETLSALPDPHLLQSWEWGEIKAHSGWHADRLLLPGQQAGKPRGACQFLWRNLSSASPYCVGYVPKGPVLDWQDAESVERMLEQIELHARLRRCVFVKIDPDVHEDSTQGRALCHALFRRGWRFSREQIQFKNTAYSDLRLSDEELLAQMKNKCRYNVNLAQRRGITVRRGVEDDLEAFYGLYRETGLRDGFLIRPMGYYMDAWRTYLRAQGDAHNPAGGVLLLAEHPEEALPVAGLVLLRYGRVAWYFYGASSHRRRRDMPNYLLQWEAMRWARDQGCDRYDWWGAPGSLDDAADPLQGVWRFKEAFGAQFQSHIGAWDYVVSPYIYALYAEGMPRFLSLMRRLAR